MSTSCFTLEIPFERNAVHIISNIWGGGDLKCWEGSIETFMMCFIKQCVRFCVALS